MHHSLHVLLLDAISKIIMLKLCFLTTVKMAKVRVRQKNQITIPLRIAEEANIKLDDMFEISCVNGGRTSFM